jgi:hypothetical protein
MNIDEVVFSNLNPEWQEGHTRLRRLARRIRIAGVVLILSAPAYGRLLFYPLFIAGGLALILVLLFRSIIRGLAYGFWNICRSTTISLRNAERIRERSSASNSLSRSSKWIRITSSSFLPFS